MPECLVISICNHKGGVGKTTTVVNLAAGLSRLDKNVLILDIDPQANATYSLGKVNPYESAFTMYDLLTDKAKILSTSYQETRDEHVKLVPGHISLAGAEHELRNSAIAGALTLRRKIDELIRETFDYVLIDCPPSLGILTVNALIASDYYIIPIEAASVYALHGIKFLQEIVEDIRNQINENLSLLGVLITMYDHRTNISKAMRTEIIRYFRKENVFNAIINRNTTIEQATLSKQTVFEFSPRAAGATDYLDMAKEVISRIHHSNMELVKNGSTY
ncbi:MAG: chromosome partitioning protein [Euryarchaeota archaeon]|nr:chromosome partitioning protein [Euryarchaeota archaeon]